MDEQQFVSPQAYYCDVNPLQGTERGKALPENHPDAHFFLVAEGGTIPMATAKRFGLTDKAKPEPDAVKEEAHEEPKARTRKKS